MIAITTGLPKPIIFVIAILFSLNLLAQNKEPVDYVNPFIGTEKSSHLTMWESKGATFPGVLNPYGMVQITPDGYMYSDKTIKSFSFINHFSGYGSLGGFNLTAFSGDSITGVKISSTFDHQHEKSTPYLYQVLLKDFNIQAAFTATERVALCKFTFLNKATAHFVLSGVTNIKILDSSAFQGESGGYYFIASFSKPFKNIAGYSLQNDKLLKKIDDATAGAFLINYLNDGADSILIKITFSTISYQGAKNNELKELPGWDFEQTILNSKEIWNTELGKIKIKSSDENAKEIFYTALYHAEFMPNILSDNGAIRDNYNALFPWDTYRTKHPLITILDPARESNMISSVLSVYDKTGWLPTDNMMGNHNTELILDGYIKGASNFNIAKACEAMYKSLMDSPYARREMAAFIQYKYVPANIANSVTHSLEFAYNSWAVAQFLEKTGNKNKYINAYKILMDRAGYYKNNFDAATGFMKAKNISGETVEGGYSEGTEWTYSWYVPHDIQGLINLMGGKKSFSKKLMACFKKDHYVHDNEPPLHYGYLFNYCGEPWKTQYQSRKILEENYSTDPGGIPGNDDLGTLSSWYVLSAMGFYPVTPGTDQYQIGSPIFKETAIHLYNGKTFTIKANGVSKQNKYIQSASINGIPLNKPWFTHQDILKGSTIIFNMGAVPNKKWGNADNVKPYSMTKLTPDFSISNLRLSATITKANEPVFLSINIKNTSKVTGMYNLLILLDGCSFKREAVILNGGETKLIKIPIILYQQGVHNINIDKIPTQKIEVTKTEPSFLFSHPEIPFPPLFNLSDSFNISVRVKNTGSYKGDTVVTLLINNLAVSSKKINLKPGEEKNIDFKYAENKEGLYNISFGNLQPITIHILDSTIKTIKDYSKLISLNPVLILNFDEAPTSIIHDFSEHNNNGIVMGNLVPVRGIFGNAVQTNATLGNYISFAPNTDLDTAVKSKKLTMMAWIYPIDEKNFSDIISKGDWDALQLKGSNQFINFYAGGWEGHEATVETPLNWNRHWHHIAGVADDQFIKLYVDGKLAVTKKREPRNPFGETGLSNYSHNLWNIGRNETAPDRVFNGYIDDVMIFKKDLTQQQIIDLMLHNF